MVTPSMRYTISRLSLIAVALVLGGASCISFSGGGTGTSGPAGVFVSADKGDTWQHLSLLPQADGVKTLDEVSVYRLIPDPQDNNALYWLSRGQGMFFSYDEGKSWQRPAAPLNTGFIYGAAIHPTDKCTIYGTNGTILYKSDDCNRSWKEIYRESGQDRIIAVAFSSFAPYGIFMAKASGDILKSEDAGKSWSVIRRLQTRVDYFQMDLLREGVMYAASRGKGLYRSEDGGVTWDNISEGLSDFSGGLEFRRMSMHPTKPGVVYWICTYGILVSNDGGDSWEAMDLINPPGSTTIYGFAVNPKNDLEMYYTATINNRSTFYRTTDGGANWTTKKVPSGQVPTMLRVHPDKESVIYMGFTIPPKE